MQTDEFIAQVQRRLDVEPEQAQRTTVGVLETLGEALSPREAHDLAAQLPRELADVLRVTADQQVEHDRDTFLVRVAERAGIDDGTSQLHAQAVTGTLRDAVTKGELVDVSLDLPPALDELLAGLR